MTALWHTNDDVALLAWLDFCLQNTYSFRDSIVSYLKKVDKPYTITQIDNHLRFLWRRYGRKPKEDNGSPAKVTWKIIEQKGSACLQKLNVDRRRQIDHLSNQISKSYLSKLQSLSDRQSRNHNLRSNKTVKLELSSFCLIEEAQQSNSLVENPEHTQEYQEPETNRELNPNFPQRETPVPFQNDGIDHISETETESDTRSPASPFKLSKAFSNDDWNEYPISGSMEINDFSKGDSVHTSPELQLGLHHFKSQYRMQLRQKDTEIEILKKDIESLLVKHQIPFRQKELENKSLKVDIEDLLDQRSRLERTERELRAEISHLIRARNYRELTANDPIETYVFKLHHQTWKQHEQLQNKGKLATFVHLTSTQQVRLEMDEISDMMEHIGTELESVFHGHDSSIPLLAPKIESDSELGSLIHIALGMSITSLSNKSLSEIMPHTTMRSIIQALTLASLKKWVFDINWPNFDSESSILFKTYKDIIAMYDGDTRLRNLNLAAHHLLIKSARFQETTLPNKAAELAVQLSYVLAPLFSAPSQIATDGLFKTWGEDAETWENRQVRFTTMFELSLKLKAAAMATTDTYEFMLYPPGTPYARDILDGTIGKGGRSDSSPFQNGPPGSELCLHASFRTYRKEHSERTDLVGDATVQPMNFITADTHSDAKHYVRSKSIILPRDTDLESWPSPYNDGQVIETRNDEITLSHSYSNPRESEAITLQLPPESQELSTSRDISGSPFHEVEFQITADSRKRQISPTRTDSQLRSYKRKSSNRKRRKTRDKDG